jgi:hypothetical protein
LHPSAVFFPQIRKIWETADEEDVEKERRIKPPNKTMTPKKKRSCG